MFKGFDIGKIFNLERIFKASPGSYFEFRQEFFIFFGILFLIGAGIRVYLFFERNRIYRKLLKKIKNMALFISIAGFAYLFFRSENIFLFSGRFILLSILIAFLIWSGFIIFYATFKMQKELKDYKKQEVIKKYLPAKKKKK